MVNQESSVFQLSTSEYRSFFFVGAGVKWPERKTDQPFTPSGGIKNIGTYISTVLCIIIGGLSQKLFIL